MELNNNGTEQHAREQEMLVLELYKFIDENKKSYLERFEECFTVDRSRRLELLKGICAELLENNALYFDYQFMHMKIAAWIYEQEVAAGERETIFDIAHSLEDIMDLYREVRFLLWRIGFKNDVQAKNTLLSLITGLHISPYCIKQFTSGAVMDKVGVSLELTELFLDRGMVRYAYHMLLYLNEARPEEVTVLYLLADICRLSGNTKKAEEYLEKAASMGSDKHGEEEKKPETE